MGYIYLFTGEGAGKTTNALGLALRSLGHRHKVVIIQFMKWWKNTGEYKIQKKLKPYYKVYQFGAPGWLKIDSKKKKTEKFGKTEFKTRKAEKIDRKYALNGLEKAGEIMLKEKPNLLVLDEINLAVHSKLLTIKEVLDFLKKVTKKTTIVMTGRYAPKALVKRADFVDVINVIKHPKHIPAQKGIQY